MIFITKFKIANKVVYKPYLNGFSSSLHISSVILKKTWQKQTDNAISCKSVDRPIYFSRLLNGENSIHKKNR